MGEQCIHTTTALQRGFKQELENNENVQLKVGLQSYKGNDVFHLGAPCACLVRSYGTMNCRIAQVSEHTGLYTVGLSST